ncbi:MAG: ATP phosphoribosyltransferase [candidate division NC10 bacterium]|nr:ATP phosphoribosyltransferase [candidate division NC10 bacterium]
MKDDLIAIALPKGRLFRESIKLFASIGVPCVEVLLSSRRLISEDLDRGIRFLALKAADVPTYVEHGAADLGIVGKDLLLEQGKDVYEPLDLGFGTCRLVVAEPIALKAKDDPRAWSSLRIATKYPNLTERHFSQKGVQVEIIKLSGSIELAPLVGLSERIVDLVASGRTLEENGLIEVEEIARSSARLIVNRASLKTNHKRVQELIDAIREKRSTFSSPLQ